MARKPKIEQIVHDLDPTAVDAAVDAALDALAEGDLAAADPKRRAAIDELAKESKASTRPIKPPQTH